MSAFFGHGNIVEGIEAGGRGRGGEGGRMDELKTDQTIVVKSNYLSNKFFCPP